MNVRKSIDAAVREISEALGTPVTVESVKVTLSNSVVSDCGEAETIEVTTVPSAVDK